MTTEQLEKKCNQLQKQILTLNNKIGVLEGMIVELAANGKLGRYMTR